MTYLSEPYFQLDGSAFGQVNCVPSGGTELIDRATVGRLRIPAPVIRRASGDTSGGLTLSQLADAVLQVTDGEVMLAVRRLDTRGQFRDLVASGRGVGFIYHTRVTSNTTRNTGSFIGLHFATVGAYHWMTGGTCLCEARILTAHAEYDVEDPGTRRGWQRWSADLVYRAMEAVGDYWTISTRDTEGVARVAIAGGKVREKPSGAAKALRVIQVGGTYNVDETVRGARWPRLAKDGGGYAVGWHRLKLGGYIRGGALR